MHVTGYWLRVMSTEHWAESWCPTNANFDLPWMKIVSTCMSATELNTSELVNPGRRQKTTPRRAANCIFSLFFWQFVHSFLVDYILHWPALPPRPLVLSSPAGARLSIPAPCTQSIYRLHIPGPRKMINRVLSFQDLFIFRVSYPWHRRWAYAKSCFFEKSFTTFTHLEHCGLCEVTPGSVESAWWQCYRFPNRQYSVTDFPQPTIHCYIFSPTDNTVLRTENTVLQIVPMQSLSATQHVTLIFNKSVLFQLNIKRETSPSKMVPHCSCTSVTWQRGWGAAASPAQLQCNGCNREGGHGRSPTNHMKSCFLSWLDQRYKQFQCNGCKR